MVNAVRYFAASLLVGGLLSAVWYRMCPLVSFDEVKCWIPEIGADSGYRHSGEPFLLKSPFHFWSGIAIGWPILVGVSLIAGLRRSNPD